jgi:SAM-dependent methyltransferase
MGLYRRWLLPRITDWSMRNAMVIAERKRIAPTASGAVLEIGAGSGLNLPFYGPGVEKLYALEPSPEMWRLAKGRISGLRFPVEFLAFPAERIPLADEAVDTVVSTFTLCSVADPIRALAETRRVLKANGRLLFVEHGRSPDRGVAAWQDRLNPPWRRLTGGCNLNRKIDDLLATAGFQLREIERGYGEGPRLFVYLYKGVAQPAALASSARPST